MPKKIDLTNQRFGKLVAISPTYKNGKTAWHCKCDCGNELDVFTFCLRNGNTKSCGCGATNTVKDEIGKRYGRLTVQKFIGVNNHHAEWECLCDCGKIVIVKGDLLRNGTVTSCGCVKIIDETNNKYGKLKVVKFNKIKNHVAFWECECECGNKIIVAGSHLRSGHTMSCGCINSRGEFIINQILSVSNIKYQTQYTIKINNSTYRFDYAIFDNNNNLLRLIEFDGEYHYSNKTDQTTYQLTHARDLTKNKYCLENNIPLVRIPYWERNNLSVDLLLSNKYLIKSE